jgi:chromosome segregation ATPase
MKTFENWYTNILEEVATAPTKSLAGDVDTIISSLDTLVKELTEELDSPELNTLNEIDGEGPSKVWQWIWWMPKARKAQQKVNKIKLNVTDMEAAAEDAKDTDQRAKINAKATIAKEQADQLQSLVDDKYNAKGDLVKKALHNEKIIGQIAAIKRATGLEDDPEKVASYKEKLAELQVKYKEDQAAIKELEPSEEEKDAEIEKKKEEQRLAKERQDKLDADAEAAKNKKKEPVDNSTEGGDDSTKTNTEGGDDSTKTEPTTDPKIKELEDNIVAKEKELADAEKSPDKNKEGIDVLKGAIAGMKKNLAAKKQKAQPQESLVNRANEIGLNELATEIGSKFDWQLDEGTALYQRYDEIIKKAEYSNSLNESRYQNLSIKDRFSRLL